MAGFLIRKDKGASKFANVWHLSGKSATQVLNIYHIVSKVAYQLWQYVKGFVYTNDGRAIKTSDGLYIKCKDQ